MNQNANGEPAFRPALLSAEISSSSFTRRLGRQTQLPLASIQVLGLAAVFFLFAISQNTFGDALIASRTGGSWSQRWEIPGQESLTVGAKFFGNLVPHNQDGLVFDVSLEGAVTLDRVVRRIQISNLAIADGDGNILDLESLTTLEISGGESRGHQGGSIGNSGRIRLNSSALKFVGGDVTLAGEGVLEMADVPRAVNIISSSPGGNSFINHNRIVGRGTIGPLLLVNEGEIDANVPGKRIDFTLFPNDSSVNNGVIKASDGGIIHFQGPIENKPGPPGSPNGVMRVERGSRITLENATIRDGQLVTPPIPENPDQDTDMIFVENNTTLDNVNIAGLIGVNDVGGPLTLKNILVNNGVIDLSIFVTPDRDRGITIGSPTTILGGSGTLILGSPKDRITAAEGADLTNGRDHTITGQGVIGSGGMLFNNFGTVRAAAENRIAIQLAGENGFNRGLVESMGEGLLEIQGTGSWENSGTIQSAEEGSETRIGNKSITNEGTIQALDGATVDISSAAIVNPADGIIYTGGEGSATHIRGARVTMPGDGGKIIAEESGTIRLSAGTVVTGGTLKGVVPHSVIQNLDRASLIGDPTFLVLRAFVGISRSITTIRGSIGTFDRFNSAKPNEVICIFSEDNDPTRLAVDREARLFGAGRIRLKDDTDDDILGAIIESAGAEDAFLELDRAHISGCGKVGNNSLRLLLKGGAVISTSSSGEGSQLLVVDPNDEGCDIAAGQFSALDDSVLRLQDGDFRGEPNPNGRSQFIEVFDNGKVELVDVLIALENTERDIIAWHENSLIILDNATIRGGILDALIGSIQNVSGATLASLVVTAKFLATDGSLTRLRGAIENRGRADESDRRRIFLDGSTQATTLLIQGDPPDEDGTVTLTGGGLVELSDSPVNVIRADREANVLVNEDNAIQGAGSIGVGKLALENRGVIEATGDNPLIIDLSGDAENEGTIRASGKGGLRFRDAVFTNRRLVQVSDESQLVAKTYRQSGANAQTLLPGGKLTADQLDITDGEFVIESGASAEVSGRFELAKEARAFVGGVLSAGLVSISQEASLQGSGTINGVVANSGFFQPGKSPGIMTIEGSYEQTSDGRLQIEIGGPTPESEHDVVSVSESTTLDGSLEVRFIDDFVPKAGDSFEIIRCANVTGTFDAIQTIGLGPSVAIETHITETGASLTVVERDPEDAPPTLSATLERDSGLQLVLSLETANGTNYVLEFSESLNSASGWHPLQEFTGDGGTKVLTFPVDDSIQGYFRIRF